MILVKGEFVTEVTFRVGTETRKLHVWRNPETGNLFGINNLDVKANRNFAFDPYLGDVGVVFEDTFTGLPK